MINLNFRLKTPFHPHHQEAKASGLAQARWCMIMEYGLENGINASWSCSFSLMIQLLLMFNYKHISEVHSILFFLFFFFGSIPPFFVMVLFSSNIHYYNRRRWRSFFPSLPFLSISDYFYNISPIYKPSSFTRDHYKYSKIIHSISWVC